MSKSRSRQFLQASVSKASRAVSCRRDAAPSLAPKFEPSRYPRFAEAPLLISRSLNTSMTRVTLLFVALLAAAGLFTCPDGIHSV